MASKHPLADPEATPRRRAMEEYAQELRSIYRKNKNIDPADVVEYARTHPESALHGRFVWDDSKAAHEYRLWQARQIITTVMSVYPDQKVRQTYVSPIEQRGSGGYIALVDVLSDKDRRAAYLKQALDELAVFQERYRDLKELAVVFAAAKKVRVRK